MKVGIQGIKASFHDVAARKYFVNQDLEVVECPTFKNLCMVLQSKSVDCCLMAIENSIAGSILTNYALLEEFNFKIIGEVYLRIKMNLMVLPGQKIQEIKIVQSHPMALLQCQEFLTDNIEMPDIKIVESSDTADSAQQIYKNHLLGHAAIASELAASTYHLEILRSGIETNQHNYTRFLVIVRGDHSQVIESPNKASLCFEVAHQPGQLAEILGILSQHQINMTKIQSVPILGRPYQYSFHVDLEWTDIGHFKKALSVLEKKTHRLVQFGEYCAGLKDF